VKLKRAFRSGGALCVAIPKDWARTLQILPGTVCMVTLKDRQISIERALVTGVSQHGADQPPPTPVGVREKGH
jgi:antitoxin component of MazEF toxin-antitoxin module